MMPKPKPLKVLLSILLVTASFLNSNGQQKGDPPLLKSMIYITPMKRTELINLVSAADCAMVFKQEVEINKLPVYLGVDNYKTSLQIVGKEDELVSAKWTLVFNDYKPADYLEFQRMSYFAYIIAGSKAVNFLNEQVSNFVKDPTQPFNGNINFEYYGNAEVSYNPKDKAIILSFIEKR